jgi:Zn-dependent protease with chaperone function
VSFPLIGVSVGLAWFLLISGAVSFVAWTVAGRMLAGAPGRRPRSAAGWLALRLWPTGAALAFLAFVFAPAFLRFEPREDTTERVGLSLALTAAAAFGQIAWPALRTWRTWRALAAVERDWHTRATPWTAARAGIPVFIVDGTAPGASLVGVFRPRLYLGRAVVQSLSSDELDAVVAHETAHVTRRDNFVRWLLVAVPDIFGTTAPGRATTARWATAAEVAADARAADGDARKALLLASALVAVARLLPDASLPQLPMSALYDGTALSDRVRRLLAGPPAWRPLHRARQTAVLILAGLALAGAGVAVHRPVHEVTEWIVCLAR